MNRRIWMLLGAIFIAVFVVCLFPAIPQREAYHNFADKRGLFGIPNCLNVVSNVLFLFVGVPGMRFTLRAGRKTNFSSTRASAGPISLSLSA